MELKDLVGQHKLTGVFIGTKKINHYGRQEDVLFITFILDGITYTATEDPDDGYRSAMKNIIISNEKVSNIFPPIEVLAMMEEDRSGRKYDVLKLINIVTGKTILAVGTKDIDDYYPSYVSEWMPENI